MGELEEEERRGVKELGPVVGGGEGKGGEGEVGMEVDV